MKKIKLLTPILGLATVATVVAPMATSCTSSSDSSTHVQAPLNNTKTLKKKTVSYTMLLDRTDYEEENFVVEARFPSAIANKNFSVSWTLTGDNVLNAQLTYNGTSKLRAGTYEVVLVVNYGSKWSEEVTVNMKVASSSNNLDLQFSTGSAFDSDPEFESEEVYLKEGESYTVTINFANFPEEYISSIQNFYYFSWWDMEDSWLWDTKPAFESVEVYLGTTLLSEDDYYAETNDYGIANISLYSKVCKQFTTSSVLTFVLNNLIHEAEEPAIFYYWGYIDSQKNPSNN